MHSGDASGIVPSSFRILRTLLSRLEDEANGAIRLPELYVQIPPERIEQARVAAAALGETVYTEYPFAPGVRPMGDDLTELVLNRTWRPQLAITGIDGLPPPADAGNVLLPYTTAKLSLRLPPTSDAKAAGTMLKTLFETDPPYGARVRFAPQAASPGWNAPALAPWLEASLARASAERVRRAAGLYGRGRHHPVHGDARREVSRRRSSSSPASSGRIRTRTARTNSCTCRPAGESPASSRRCWPIMRREKRERGCTHKRAGTDATVRHRVAANDLSSEARCGSGAP